MHYFDPSHLLSLLFAAALVLALYFPLRKKSPRAKKIALGIVIGVNIGQHFLKSFVWPHLWGSGFTLENTAYNVCALLILATPFCVYGKSGVLKQFLFYAGTCAGTFALLFPFWFVGKSLLQWEFVRFWFCHALLLASSVLPGLWGMVPFRMRDGWKFGLLALGALCIILLNNVIFLLAFGQTDGSDLYEALLAHNPVWLAGPPQGDNVLKTVLVALCPPPFRGGEGRAFTPILWYAVPVYAVITAAAYALGAIAERIQKNHHRRLL